MFPHASRTPGGAYRQSPNSAVGAPKRDPDSPVTNVFDRSRRSRPPPNRIGIHPKSGPFGPEGRTTTFGMDFSQVQGLEPTILDRKTGGLFLGLSSKSLIIYRLGCPKQSSALGGLPPPRHPASFWGAPASQTLPGWEDLPPEVWGAADPQPGWSAGGSHPE